MALGVDTDVVSFLYQRDTRAELYRPHLNDSPFIISFWIGRCLDCRDCSDAECPFSHAQPVRL